MHNERGGYKSINKKQALIIKAVPNKYKKMEGQAGSTQEKYLTITSKKPGRLGGHRRRGQSRRIQRGNQEPNYGNTDEELTENTRENMYTQKTNHQDNSWGGHAKPKV